MEDEIGGPYRTLGRDTYKILVGKLKGRDDSEDLDVDDRIILE
jgi:hypothetical protein